MKFTYTIAGKKVSFELGAVSAFPSVLRQHMTVGQWEAFRKLAQNLNSVYAHNLLGDAAYNSALRALAHKIHCAAIVHNQCMAPAAEVSR